MILEFPLEERKINVKEYKKMNQDCAFGSGVLVGSRPVFFSKKR